MAELEKKAANMNNRKSVSFKEILMNASLNRSMAQQSPNPSPVRPPIKMARISEETSANTRPTSIQQSPFEGSRKLAQLNQTMETPQPK